jgi:WD40 repeat protein
VDLIPDYSTSSRRPPQLTFRDGSSELRIRAHPQTGCVALSGTYIVVGHDHHIKIFDLAKSELPLLKLDTKDIGPKDSKVSCMEFRPTASEADRGYLLWIGTKEGHIFELDIRTGIVTGIKQSAHHHCIVHIFRHSRSMVTLDEFGKALVFSPDVSNQEDISLALTIPRVVRTTEKQDFVKMLNGKLWTAIRTDHHSHLTLKSPTIRVFDLFNTANTEKSLLPTEHVGPVTSATILPSQPGMVYVAHEEGSISMWELNTEDGYRCVEVMKISASDILSLEGVSNRLWAGSRNGTISAYDVSQKPWLVTNSWNAHPGFPVMKLMINHYAITKVGKLCVASIGGDDQLRLWDGLLAWDWVGEFPSFASLKTVVLISSLPLSLRIDKELVKSEASFSSFRNLNVLVVSWNCGSARPDSLNGNPQNCNLLNDALHSVDSPPDIIVFGFQEVIDLESRRMMAYNVLLGGKKKTDDGLLEKVTGAYKRWKDRLVLAVQAAMPKDVSYCVTHNESLIGLFSCIFVKNKERPTFDDVSVTTIKRGMGGWYGNKVWSNCSTIIQIFHHK